MPVVGRQTKISAFFSKKVNISTTPGDELKDMSKRTAKTKSTTTTTRSSDSESPVKKARKTDSNLVTSQAVTTVTQERLKTLEKDTKGVVNNFGETWFKAVNKEFDKPYFQKLCHFIASERSRSTIYPKPVDVFTWTRACKLSAVKVVILGQDPYHGYNQAHGLAFSVLPGVQIPPSLQNMYKELTTDIPDFKAPDHGNLMGWASQGVLLLNAVLTVKASCANSHKDQGWEQFTDAVIQYLNKNTRGVVFLLWGSYAQKKGAHIDKKNHCVLKTVHPSPLSAHRGFFGCKHFSKANDYLKKEGKSPIDWRHLPKHC